MARRRIQTSDTDRVTTMGHTAHRECSGVRMWILRLPAIDGAKSCHLPLKQETVYA